METKERCHKNCGLEIFVDIMEQSRQLDKFIQFLNVVIAWELHVGISYVNKKSLQTVTLLHEIQDVFRFLTCTWKSFA